MKFKLKMLPLFILLIILNLVPLSAQNLIEGDYILVQYIAENYSYRSVMHFALSAVDDTTGTYLELFREEGEPDSGGFTFHYNPDQTFTIDDSIGLLYGHMDDQGDVFSLVEPDEDMGYFGIGIRKSSGKSLSNLSGQYWVARFECDEEDYFDMVALDVIDFDGSGNATLYNVDGSIADIDSFDFSYSVEDDGEILFDDFLRGIISPDNQVWVAARSDDGYHTYLYGLKIGSDLDDSVLYGPYNFTQYYAGNEQWDDQAAFYGRLDFNGMGTGVVAMNMGEATNDTFYYAIGDDGLSDTDSLLAAVGADHRYFLALELLDSNEVSFGLGIKGVDPTTGIKKDKHRIPKKITLAQNYPNPFNPTTAIGYRLSAVSDVALSVYNLLGQKVITLVSEKQSAGSYQIEWDATGFASGMYFYVLETGSFREVRKMVLVR